MSRPGPEIRLSTGGKRNSLLRWMRSSKTDTRMVRAKTLYCFLASSGLSGKEVCLKDEDPVG